MKLRETDVYDDDDEDAETGTRLCATRGETLVFCYVSYYCEG